ncbi:hypothetical protein CK203_033429 [Vitis vinifera]|uniref:Uncharacterized protein n=1 Tax=Vitis vinifera TaxID=29760 RepID=A0A438HMR9_VITVI|nr:hypothetical protein CK203_033429 [Vitis vinifera]
MLHSELLHLSYQSAVSGNLTDFHDNSFSLLDINAGFLDYSGSSTCLSFRLWGNVTLPRFVPLLFISQGEVFSLWGMGFSYPFVFGETIFQFPCTSLWCGLILSAPLPSKQLLRPISSGKELGLGWGSGWTYLEKLLHLNSLAFSKPPALGYLLLSEVAAYVQPRGLTAYNVDGGQTPVLLNMFAVEEDGSKIRSLVKSSTGPSEEDCIENLQNDNRTVLPKPLENSPAPKDAETTKNVIKLLGAKRPTPDRPLSPSRPQSLSSNGANGHLVYVRRKSEAEPAPTTTSSGVPSVPIPLGKPVNGPHGANSESFGLLPQLNVADMQLNWRKEPSASFWRKGMDAMFLVPIVQKPVKDALVGNYQLHSGSLCVFQIRNFYIRMLYPVSMSAWRELERIKALNVLGKYDTKMFHHS